MAPTNSWDDAKTTWARVGGVIAAVGVISALAVNLGFNPKLVWPVTTFGGFIVLLTLWFNDKQDKRFEARFQAHERESDERLEKVSKTLQCIQEAQNETRLDTLRIQLIQYIQYQPHNHDTILSVAHRYFVELGGDWVMTEQFVKWAESESVPVPAEIAKAIEVCHNK